MLEPCLERQLSPFCPAYLCTLVVPLLIESFKSEYESKYDFLADMETIGVTSDYLNHANKI